MTGRVVDIEIDPKNPSIVVRRLGLRRTLENGRIAGITFEQIFPRIGQVEAFSLCCVVVDPKDSNVVWLGTGENASQRSAHFGTGALQVHGRRQDLEAASASRNPSTSARSLIDPRNSNVVWVASQGPLFSEGGDRGLYKTTDGGATWNRVLHVNDDTGVSDVVLRSEEPGHRLGRHLSAPAARRADDRRRSGWRRLRRR